MRIKLYNNILVVFAIALVIPFQAQKVDKKFVEKFAVNKDVTVVLEATNTEILVETWNKNQVLVEASIEIEGLSKSEAEKYIKRYQFEALGNKEKVKISSKGKSFKNGTNNFVFFNDHEFSFPKVTLPNLDSISLPKMEDIAFPDIEFSAMSLGLDNLDFDFEQYSKDGKKYFFQWKDSAKNITIKSKEDWEKFKKTKAYEKVKQELKAQKLKIKADLQKASEELKKVNQEEIMRELTRVKIDREMMQKEMRNAMMNVEKARAQMQKEMKTYHFNSSSNEMSINGKKVKITKKLTIKVPKGAKLDLNTRYGKVSLPKTVASGSVSYGDFYAEALSNSDLKIDNTPVSINSLSTSSLVLTNVADAKVTSVSNANLTSDSGKLSLKEVYNDVIIQTSFGELFIDKINSDSKKFKVMLKHSAATMDFSNLKDKMSYSVSKTSSNSKQPPTVFLNKKETTINGNFVMNNSSKAIQIEGKYSRLIAKK